ncbi:MAG: CaiB/BaiF CoA transferase family protein [Candidatus Puniceispirillales bacterium]|jgi:crotonobetainyl-CoA:carnitine CoA-transferase CaiB-like acyl-CoA transferase|nr:CoA transferase [SAR116 cluster bacterium]|tara:strand:+ start:691 stop:1902 length:1212 start_codon:yes stop_codon:yes gene_type:complete
MSEINGALSGLKIVACSTAQAGTVPYMLMADLGAEVIKIETPGKGDNNRGSGYLMGSTGSFFETNNRGVKSLTLNLKSDKGQKILHDLVKDADIFGQNFRPGVAEKLNFDYDTLSKINPKIVYASVSAYGPDAPDGHLPGTDAVGQALSGIAEAYSIPGNNLRTGVASVADESCAILTFGGILAAYINAQKTGKGQKLETSLVGSAFRLLGWTMTTAMWSNRPPITGARINGTRERPGIAACFNDVDGKPFALQLDPDDWQEAMKELNFFDVLQKENLIDLGLAFESDEKKTQILSKLAELFSTNKRDHWISILRNADMISTHVNTMLEASNDPNLKENNYVTEVWYPELNKNMKVHGTPWKFSKTPANIKRAPKLGEHNSELLNKLGYSEKDIQNLIEDKII